MWDLAGLSHLGAARVAPKQHDLQGQVEIMVQLCRLFTTPAAAQMEAFVRLAGTA